ncbi:Uncharacterised protein [Streptococcus pneumoniae]|nr:Uncharacterised protein [Streptococcus pneumoniae]
MHDTITDKLRIFKTRNHLEDTLLFSPFEVGLETNDIVEATSCIILTKLHNRIRCFKFSITRSCVVVRILKTDWLHRAIKHSFNATFGHNFDWHTSFKVLFFFKRIERCFFRIDQGFMEIHKLLLGHWSIEIGCFSLIITRFEIDLTHIDSVDIDNRRCCIVEIEAIAIIKGMNLFSQGIASQGTGRHNCNNICWQFCNFITHHFNQGVVDHFFGYHLGETITIHRKGSTGRNTCSLSRFQDNRTQATHFFLKEANGICQSISTQGIGTNQLSKIVCFVLRC